MGRAAYLRYEVKKYQPTSSSVGERGTARHDTAGRAGDRLGRRRIMDSV